MARSLLTTSPIATLPASNEGTPLRTCMDRTWSFNERQPWHLHIHTKSAHLTFAAIISVYQRYGSVWSVSNDKDSTFSPKMPIFLCLQLLSTLNPVPASSSPNAHVRDVPTRRMCYHLGLLFNQALTAFRGSERGLPNSTQMESGSNMDPEPPPRSVSVEAPR